MANVLQLNQQNNQKNPNETIYNYLTRKGQNSLNTKKTYERSIRDFFRTMRNKEIEELDEQDLIFAKKQIESYQIALKENYKGATVNNSITAMRECYLKLKDDGFPVDPDWFSLERYDEHDTETYDTLSHSEVCRIIQLVSSTRKGAEKALLIRTAYATAFRRRSLLDLKWTDIVERDGVWFIKTLGKGNKWSYKKLSTDLYDSLMKHKQESDGDKIFKITDKTLNKMMNYIRENMDFGDRKIVFHSFKKASINEVNIITGGDLKAMQAHGDHSDVSVTLNTYLAKKALDDLVTVDINHNVPVEKFEELSKEDLVSLIKSMDRNTQIRLLQKMGAI